MQKHLTHLLLVSHKYIYIYIYIILTHIDLLSVIVLLLNFWKQISVKFESKL